MKNKMAKYFLLLISFVIVIISCQKKVTNRQPANKKFKTFEISYSGGWGGSFSFAIDSNNIFLTMGRNDSLRYGLVPDSITFRIDSILSVVQKDSSIHFINKRCDDCDNVSILASTANDTLKVIQLGRLTHNVYNLISTIRNFVDSTDHSYYSILKMSKTQEDIFELPPPVTNF